MPLIDRKAHEMLRLPLGGERIVNLSVKFADRIAAHIHQLNGKRLSANASAAASVIQQRVMGLSSLPVAGRFTRPKLIDA